VVTVSGAKGKSDRKRLWGRGGGEGHVGPRIFGAEIITGEIDRRRRSVWSKQDILREKKQNGKRKEGGVPTRAPECIGKQKTLTIRREVGSEKEFR